MSNDPQREEKLAALPTSPGVYLMKDAHGDVLYVGKAAILRSRVRSYFQSPDNFHRRTQALVLEIADFEVIQTATESEAFLLEDSLIKRYQPRFNVRLRDDKRYPYLKITDEAFPRVRIVRRRYPDGTRYFGPYTNAKAMRATLKLAQKLFPIRSCSLDLPLKTPRRPCLNYHIGRCSGPCAELITQAEYGQLIDQAAMLFDGRISGLMTRLEKAMRAAAVSERFERAAHLRDQHHALQRSLESQSVVLSDQTDRDVIGLASEEDRACVLLFAVRDGRLVGRQTFFLRAPEDTANSEILDAFITQYYANASSIPREILAPFNADHQDALSQWMSDLRGRKVEIKVPQRGEKRSLVAMACENAKFALKQDQKQTALRKETSSALIELVDSLGLNGFPQRIEAFDISNTQGEEATGSMVVFENGRPRRDAYRHFKVHLSGKPDDYAMMKEVVRRRFRRGLAELANPTIARGKFSDLPDLVLIDGGKGQLKVAVDVLQELNIEGMDVIGLAKREEEVFKPGGSQSIRLPMESEALLLLRRIRDEAHRFAITYHRRLRSARSLSSVLDDIAGIGPKRKSALMKTFGSVDRLAQATPEDVALSAGIPQALASRILSHLKDPSRDAAAPFSP
ncbi:excinuclease ABC subunit UvrC [Candidatus Bipolaricaulota bacterium]|nr:excinuclease ABC subunit UvrC [Candidatus Bipolaricaulota bacterium]TFH08732.1 MAG: excinuclease ABC subunit UvrC [Candidatus Atribacteria bacterium]